METEFAAQTQGMTARAAVWESFVNICVRLGWRLIVSVVIIIVGSLLLRLILHILRSEKTFRKSDPIVRSFACSFAKVTVYLIMVVSVVAVLGIETASIITVVASAGAALALALQGSLSNLAGGMMLLIFRPFHSGDFIEVNGIGGTVIDVGIFYTTLRTPDNRQVDIPNGSLISSVIINNSREKTRRVEIVLNVAYGTDVESLKTLILDEVSKHELVLDTPAPFVRMTEAADSSLNITVRVWCETPNFWDTKFEMTEALHSLLVKNGYEIPFPQVDVHIKNK